MSISRQKINHISSYIFDNFNSERMKLIEYLSSCIDEISDVRNANLSTEEIDDLCSVESHSFIQLAKKLQLLSDEKKYKSNINITHSIDYYIEVTSFGAKRLANERILYLNILKKISSLHNHEKGGIFEKFCSLFLEDIGVECKVTSLTGDEGIDILGIINISLNNPFFKFVFDGKIYLLAQVKCYDENKKVDTPVIRHLIGDSSFYKYNEYNDKYAIRNKPLYLMIFSYSGFTKSAKKFAEANDVIALNGNELVDIICNFDDISNVKSVKYLLDVDRDI